MVVVELVEVVNKVVDVVEEEVVEDDEADVEVDDEVEVEAVVEDVMVDGNGFGVLTAASTDPTLATRLFASWELYLSHTMPLNLLPIALLGAGQRSARV